jgi:hypothetical protein
MPVWRMQLSTWLDTTFPADAMIITPHFNDSGAGTDPEGLATDLIEAWRTYTGLTLTQMNCKAYDAQGTAPVYPQADVTTGTGGIQVASLNRDVALCLSYFATHNRPRTRGRLYIPVCCIGQAPNAAKASSTNMQRVADLVPILTDLGGADVDWCVYSRRDDTARTVTNWYVDNEWDTQRRRGTKSTARLAGTVSE